MEDLTNITHLKLPVHDLPFIESSTHGKRLFSSANRLQELELTPKPTHTDDNIILRSILKNPHNKRIIINTLHYLYLGLLEEYHQKIMKDFGRLYEVQIASSRKLVLIKKEQTREEGYSLFGVLPRLWIIS